MELAPSGVQLTFEITFSAPSLPVGMSVYDMSGESPVLVSGPTLMTNVVENTYTGNFTAEDNKTYLIFKAVYTDDTLATLDTSYAQGSESIVTDDGGGGGSETSNCPIVGYVQSGNTLVGFIVC